MPRWPVPCRCWPAASWPTKPINLVVPFPAGGPTDTAARIVGQKLAERLEQGGQAARHRRGFAHARGPAVAEQGFTGFDAVSWGGLLAPVGTPKEVVARIGNEVQQILAEPQTRDRMLAIGVVAHFQGAEPMAVRIQQDDAKWGKVIRDKAISVE